MVSSPLPYTTQQSTHGELKPVHANPGPELKARMLRTTCVPDPRNPRVPSGSMFALRVQLVKLGEARLQAMVLPCRESAPR